MLFEWNPRAGKLILQWSSVGTDILVYDLYVIFLLHSRVTVVHSSKYLYVENALETLLTYIFHTGFKSWQACPVTVISGILPIPNCLPDCFQFPFLSFPFLFHSTAAVHWVCMPDSLYTLSYLIVTNHGKLGSIISVYRVMGQTHREVRRLAQDHTANKRLKGNLLPPPSRHIANDVMMLWICITELTYPIS